MKPRRHQHHHADFPHEHWFVPGRNGEQCVYCGLSPEEVNNKEETHEDGRTG